MRKTGFIFLLALVIHSLPAQAQKEIQGYWLNKNREAEIDKNTKKVIVGDLIIDSPSISITYTTVKNAAYFQHKDTTMKYKPQVPLMKTVNTKTYFAKLGINPKSVGLTKPTPNVYMNNCKCRGIEELVMIDGNTMIVFFGKSYTVLTRSKTLSD